MVRIASIGALASWSTVTVSGAAYWSERLGEGLRREPVLTVNATRIEAVLPYREVDPWAGLEQARATEPGLVFDASPAPGDQA